MALVINIQAIRQLLAPPQKNPTTDGGRQRTQRCRRSSNARHSETSTIDTLALVLDRVVKGSLEPDTVLAAAQADPHRN
jgi:hypothetical protein